MARLDKIHEIVKAALVKDGWTITHDPYKIEYRTLLLFADLGAEKLFSAEREGRKIVVEVKSFIQISHIQDLKLALGQYQLYNVYLKLIAPERKLYLAVSEDIYKKFLSRKEIKVVTDKLKISLMVANLQTEEISKWIR